MAGDYREQWRTIALYVDVDHGRPVLYPDTSLSWSSIFGFLRN